MLFKFDTSEARIGKFNRNPYPYDHTIVEVEFEFQTDVQTHRLQHRVPAGISYI